MGKIYEACLWPLNTISAIKQYRPSTKGQERKESEIDCRRKYEKI